MAATAHTHEAQFAEPIESSAQRQQKTALLHGLINESRRIVCITGAGLSTAAGIRDYRSGANTVLATGQGLWTEAKQKQKQGGAAASASAAKRQSPRKRKSDQEQTPVEHKSDETKPDSQELEYGDLLDDEYDEQFNQTVRAAVPTFTHRALVELEKRGKLELVITQNGDNLHRLSGLNPSKLCEIHGNWWLEQCVKCDRKYYSDARLPTPATLLTTAQMKAARSKLLAVAEDSSDDDGEAVSSRTRSPKLDPFDGKYTGSFCPRAECLCAPLASTVIEFGDCCFDDDAIKTEQAIQQSDLVLILGSSVVVDPLRTLLHSNIWCKDKGEPRRKLVFINLQPTELKDDSALFIHALLDSVFVDLMQLMQVDVPPFTLRRWIRVEQRAIEGGRLQLTVGGVMDGTSDADSIDLFKSIELILPSAQAKAKRQRRSRSSAAAAAASSSCAIVESAHSTEPVTGAHTFIVHNSQSIFTGRFTLQLQFYGHKKEPDYALSLDFAPDQVETISLEFDLAAGSWRQHASVPAVLPQHDTGRKSQRN